MSRETKKSKIPLGKWIKPPLVPFVSLTRCSAMSKISTTTVANETSSSSSSASTSSSAPSAYQFVDVEPSCMRYLIPKSVMQNIDSLPNLPHIMLRELYEHRSDYVCEFCNRRDFTKPINWIYDEAHLVDNGRYYENYRKIIRFQKQLETTIVSNDIQMLKEYDENQNDIARAKMWNPIQGIRLGCSWACVCTRFCIMTSLCPLCCNTLCGYCIDARAYRNNVSSKIKKIRDWYNKCLTNIRLRNLSAVEFVRYYRSLKSIKKDRIRAIMHPDLSRI